VLPGDPYLLDFSFFTFDALAQKKAPKKKQKWAHHSSFSTALHFVDEQSLVIYLDVVIILQWLKYCSFHGSSSESLPVDY